MQMTFVAAATALLAFPAQGQETRDGGSKSGFFRRERVEFWSAPPTEPVQESIWAEPMRSEEGRVSVRVPPPPVLQFLENPSRETGEKYLAWQQARMQKLKAAIEVLKELQVSRTPPPSPTPSSIAGELLYFRRDGCPWCDKQDKVIDQFTQGHPEIKIRRLSPAEAPELWKAYGVSAVPTLIARGPGGRTASLAGFSSSDKVLKALQEVSRGAP